MTIDLLARHADHSVVTVHRYELVAAYVASPDQRLLQVTFTDGTTIDVGYDCDEWIVDHAGADDAVDLDTHGDSLLS